MSRKLFINVTKYALGLGLGALFLFLAFRNVKYSDLQQIMEKAAWGWLVPSFFIGILAHIARAWRWAMLTQAAGFPVKTQNAFWSLMVGYMANNAVPRLGEVTRCTMLARAEGIPFAAAMGTVVVERVLDVLFLLVFLGMVFLLEADKLLQYFAQVGGGGQATGGIPVWLWALLATGFLGLVGVIVLRRQIQRTKIGQKAWEFGLTLTESILSVRDVKRMWLFVLLSFTIWFFYCLYAYVMLRAIPETAVSDFYFAFFATVMGAVGMAMPIPGGTGPFHQAVQFSFVVFGFSPTLGGAAAIWLHTPQFLFPIIIGAIGYFVLILRPAPPSRTQCAIPVIDEPPAAK